MFARLRVIAGPNRGAECVTDQSEIIVAVDAETNVHFNPTADSGRYEKQGKIFFQSNAWHLHIDKGPSWFLDGKKINVQESTKLKSGSVVRFSAFGPDLRFEISLQPFPPPQPAAPLADARTTGSASNAGKASTAGNASAASNVMVSHHYEMIDSLLEAGAAGEAGDTGEAIWYVAHASGGQYGPADSKTLKAWIAEGRVSADSRVWRKGWPDWRPASAVMNVPGANPVSPASTAASATATATATKTEAVNGSQAANVVSEPVAASEAVPNSALTAILESKVIAAISDVLRQNLLVVLAGSVITLIVLGLLCSGAFSPQGNSDLPKQDSVPSSVRPETEE